MLFRSSVNYEELQTILCEIEGVMNCRAITYVYSDDTEEALTPSHLSHGRRIMSPNQNVLNDESYENVNLTKRMKYLQTLKEHY